MMVVREAKKALWYSLLGISMTFGACSGSDEQAQEAIQQEEEDGQDQEDEQQEQGDNDAGDAVNGAALQNLGGTGMGDGAAPAAAGGLLGGMENAIAAAAANDPVASVNANASSANVTTTTTDGNHRNFFQNYVVRRGDTLSKIAIQFYGNYRHWPLIAQASNVAQPNRIYPGNVLRVPSLNLAAGNHFLWVYDLVLNHKLNMAATGTQPNELPVVTNSAPTMGHSNHVDSHGYVTTYNSANQNNQGWISVMVQRGDTLASIAERNLGHSRSWRQIYHQNRDRIQNPNRIYPGMLLRFTRGHHYSPGQYSGASMHQNPHPHHMGSGGGHAHGVPGASHSHQMNYPMQQHPGAGSNMQTPMPAAH